MGDFRYGSDPVTIGDTGNIVLERLPLDDDDGDREQFRLHRTVTYRTTVADTPFEYTVPPAGDADFVTDLASVPQFLTWLVPRSGRHLPAALVHDGMVDDPDIDRWQADRLFRDGMGDLGVGLIRRWVMWTAVSLKTIQVRGGRRLQIGAFGSLVLVALLGIAATVNLAVDRTLVPWMGARDGLDGFVAELALGIAGAIVIPIVLGALLWAPIRSAGMVAGVALAVLFHVTVLVLVVYGLYRLLEATPRSVQVVALTVIVAASAVTFTWALLV